MATKHEMMQRVIRVYKEQTGKTEILMEDVANFAVSTFKWKLPAPVDPIHRLANEFAQAAREEIKHDEKTGRPYRVNHALRIRLVGKQLSYSWINIDETSRPKMLKSLVQRREGMVGDAVQLSFDAEHWNNIHPNEEPIDIPMDFAPDIEWRRNSPKAS